MPKYRPITNRSHLPKPDSEEAREHTTVDFKSGVDPNKLDEMAKDIASFANALGGSIIVGTTRIEDGVPLAYPGLPPDLAEELHRQYERAAIDKLSPHPIVDVLVIDADEAGKKLVIVNVEPYPDQPVGAMAGADNAWRFPHRVASHARYWRPEMLPMFTNAEIRRMVILLESIPTEMRAKLKVYVHSNPPGALAQSVRLKEIAPARNGMGVEFGRSHLWIPLDDIELVWQESDNVWAVRVSGYFASVDGSQFADARRYISAPRGRG